MIKEVLDKKSGLLHGEGVTKKEIKEAEKKLGLKFNSDYKDYLLIYGIVAYNGHEITGLSMDKRTNVVDCTLDELKDNYPKDVYVIERTGMDGVIIWQSTDGIIYYSSDNSPLTKYCESLSEYFLKY